MFSVKTIAMAASPRKPARSRVTAIDRAAPIFKVLMQAMIVGWNVCIQTVPLNTQGPGGRCMKQFTAQKRIGADGSPNDAWIQEVMANSGWNTSTQGDWVVWRSQIATAANELMHIAEFTLEARLRVS